jgi:hypothetical protein
MGLTTRTRPSASCGAATAGDDCERTDAELVVGGGTLAESVADGATASTTLMRIGPEYSGDFLTLSTAQNALDDTDGELILVSKFHDFRTGGLATTGE